MIFVNFKWVLTKAIHLFCAATLNECNLIINF